MNAPSLTWRKYNSNSHDLELAKFFDALTVDAGSESSPAEFILINNYKNLTPDYNKCGTLSITGILSAAVLDGKYFDFSSPMINYRLWFNVDGSNNQPVANTRTLIAVALNSTTDDAAGVATKIKNALNAVTELFDLNGDGNNDTVYPFAADSISTTVEVTMSYPGLCRTPSNGTSGFTITQPEPGQGGIIAEAINMSITAVNASGFSGVADGDQAIVKIQFAVDDGSGNDVWGAYDPVINAFKSEVEGVPNAFYAQVGSGGALNLSSTRLYSRNSLYSTVVIPGQTTYTAKLKGTYIDPAVSDDNILLNYKGNYAKIRIVVAVQPDADAGQLDFITRGTYSYV